MTSARNATELHYNVIINWNDPQDGLITTKATNLSWKEAKEIREIYDRHKHVLSTAIKENVSC